MTEQQFFTETGAIAYCKNFRELKTLYGLKMALRARFARLFYIVKLWLLRESAIISILIENYEKIPKNTFSYLIISIFARFASLRKLNEKLGIRLQNSFTKNI